VFAPLEGEARLVAAGILPESLESLRARWLERVSARLASVDLPVPAQGSRPAADGRTRRTDEFAWLHGEFTMVSGSEADATW
jgi:1,2-phenylacetyl-CoA epoxidase catalytic subunit